MNKTLRAFTLAASLLAVSSTIAAAAPKAKISPVQAKSDAVKAVPGKATKATYEFEDGHWQYAVLVTNKHGQMYEVEVSSTTGKIYATEKTSAAAEAAEAAADAKAAKAKSGKM